MSSDAMLCYLYKHPCSSVSTVMCTIIKWHSSVYCSVEQLSAIFIFTYSVVLCSPLTSGVLHRTVQYSHVTQCILDYL